jgi:hypothetical protein
MREAGSIGYCHCLIVIDGDVQLTRNGIVLSWAVEGQGGRFHVNEKNNTAIVQVNYVNCKR